MSKPSEKRQLAGFFLAYAKQLGVFLFSLKSLEKSPASDPVNLRRGRTSLDNRAPQVMHSASPISFS